MVARRAFLGLLLLCLGSSLVGCSAPMGLDSIQVSPTAQALTVGQTAQMTAIGTYGNSKHLSTQDITKEVTWTSSATSVATVSSTGLVIASDAGTTTITATSTAYNGPTSSSATITVAPAPGGASGGNVVSLAIIPGSQSVAAPTQTSQFIAIGTTAAGATLNLSGKVAWSSSSTQIATIGATTGLATAVGRGTTTITALYTSGSTVVAGTATFNVTGGATQQFTAVSITPNSQALSASGQTSQLIALGTSGSTGLLSNVTNSSQIAWSSSTPTIATVSSTGLITGVGVGNSTITAVLTNPDGSVVSNTASVAVSITAPAEPLLSLTIIPSSITVGNLQDTGQFLAIGTYSVAPYVRDVTNIATWLTSFPNSFPVSNNSTTAQGKENAGVVTAFGSGSATIIAEIMNPSDGTIQTATATFNCPQALANPNGNPPTLGTCVPGTQAASLLSTLTVYNEGLNTTAWQVTASSATGTPNVLHCGPGYTGAGGSVCTATYPVGSVVVLTAQGAAFGGWSSNCTPSDQNGVPLTTAPFWTAAGPNYCVVSLTSDDTVGGIFN
jgi:uncharacterized protein YjdB